MGMLFLGMAIGAAVGGVFGNMCSALSASRAEVRRLDKALREARIDAERP